MTSSHPNERKEAPALPPGLQARLQQAGIRRTLATRALLGLFLARPQALLGHAQAMNGLLARGVAADRVTVYRLLDRLAACGVLRRQGDAQARSWRYRLAPPDTEVAVACFECSDCSQQIAMPQAVLDAMPWADAVRQGAAAQGHQVAGWALCLRGRCAACVERSASAGAGWEGGGVASA